MSKSNKINSSRSCEIYKMVSSIQDNKQCRQQYFDSLFEETDKKMSNFIETSLLRLICLNEWKSQGCNKAEKIDLNKELKICLDECGTEDSEKLKQIPKMIEDYQYKDVSNIIKDILMKCRILDIRKIENSLPDTNLINKLKGREVWLFLGNDNRGKSSTIHFLLGSDGEKKPFKYNELEFIKIREKINKSEFEDEKLVAVPVKLCHFGIKANNDEIIMCDVPCLTNNINHETDIIEGLMIVNAFRECDRVKPVIVVSKEDFDEDFRTFKQLCNKLSMIMSSLENNLSSFSFLFTKIQKGQLNWYFEKFEKTNKLEIEQNKIFVSMYNKMKTTSFCVNREQNNHIELLNSLVGSSCIENPMDSFVFSISDTYETINKQMEYHIKSIETYFKMHKDPVVLQKILEMEFLKNKIKNQQIENYYNEASSYLTKEITKYYVDFKNMIDIKERFKTEKIFKSLKEHKEIASKWKIALNQHLDINVPSGDNYTQLIQNKVNDYSTQIFATSLDDETLLLMLEIVFEIFLNFPDPENKKYAVNQDEILQRLKEKFEKDLKEEQFQTCGKFLTNIKKYDKVYEEKVLKHYSDLKDFLSSQAILKESEIKEKLEIGQIFEEDIDVINKNLKYIEKMISTNELAEHLPKDFKKILDELLKHLSDFFENLVKQAQNNLRSKKCINEDLKKLMIQIKNMKNISQIDSRISAYFESIMRAAFKKINEQCEDVRRESDIKEMEIFLNEIKQIDWLETNLHSDLIEKIKGIVSKKLKSDAEEIELNWKSFQDVKKFNDEIKRLKDLAFKMDIYVSIDGTRDYKYSRAFESIKQGYKEIELQIKNNQPIDKDFIVNSYIFIKQCQCDFINEIIDELNKECNQLYKDYFSNLKRNFEEIIKFLVEYNGDNYESEKEKFLDLVQCIGEIVSLINKTNSCRFDGDEDFNVLEYCTEKLENIYQDLSNKLESQHVLNYGNFKKLHSLAFSLTVIDKFNLLIDKKNSSNLSFSTLFIEHREKYIKNAKNIQTEIQQAIVGKKYEFVSVFMKNLNSINTELPTYSLLSKELSDSVRKLINETSTEMKSLFINDTINQTKETTFRKHYEDLNNAIKFLSDLIKNIDLRSALNNINATLTIEFKKNIEYMSQLLNQYHYKDFEDSLKVFEITYSNLKAVGYEDIINVLEITNARDEQLKNIMNEYEKAELNNIYYDSLNSRYDSLSKIADKNYQNVVKSIEKSVVIKFKSAIEKELIFKEVLEPEMRKNKLDELRKYTHLPEKMKNEVNKMLSEFDKAIPLLENIDKQVKDKNIEKISELFAKEEIKPFKQTYENDLKKFIKNELFDVKDKIGRSQVNELVDKLEMADRIRTNLYNYCSDMSEDFKEIKDKVNLYVIQLENDVKKCNCDSFTFIIELNEKKDLKVLKDLLPSLNKILTELILSLKAIQKEEEQNLINYLNASILDLNLLNDSLNQIKKWDPIMLKLKENFQENFLTYKDLNNKAKKMFGELLDHTIRRCLLNGETKKLRKDYDTHYKELNSKLLIFSDIIILNNHFYDDSSLSYVCVKKRCEDKLSEIKEIKANLNSFLYEDESSFMKQCEDFNIVLNNLESFSINITAFKIDVSKNISSIKDKIQEEINTIIKKASDTNNDIEFVKQIIYLKIIALNIHYVKTVCETALTKALSDYKRKNDNSVIPALGVLLDKSSIGKLILSESRLFEGYNLYLFNSRIQRKDVDYVLENIKGTEIDGNFKDNLSKRYGEFETEYERIVKENLEKSEMNFHDLILEIKNFIGKGVLKMGENTITNQIKSKIHILLAKIFALWTLKNASHYFEAEGEKNQNRYLFTPHAAQVIAIFRMLNIEDDSNEEFKNNLVEIKTGEGKSVVLAVAATLLALFGFDISCVCYSDYLSNRDYNTFSSLFNDFGLCEFIHYGTFQKLCEDYVNRKGSVRETVERYIKGEETKMDQRISNRPKLLLIDEVDVFFSKDFYGNVYIITALIKDPSVKMLTDYLWANRKKLPEFNKILVSPAFLNCKNLFKNYEFLLDEVLKVMLEDINNFDHDYEVCDDKIGYREIDRVVFNVVYGYKTMFAYYNERDNKKISEESLKENIAIQINCGSFSYGAIAHQFGKIIGVTGTLESLSDSQNEIIEKEYKITKKTFVPSVYGANNLKFYKEIFVENSEENYRKTICQKIKEGLDGTTVGTKRACLVVFESKSALEIFLKSPEFSEYADKANFLTENASSDEKVSRINKATLSGQVTLLTRSYGRGTDFVVRDKYVDANGGVHVVQTFLSEDYSEEVQIKGRTARQGALGSFNIVVHDKSLGKFRVKLNEIPKETYKIYDFLHEKRKNVFEDQYQTTKVSCERNRKSHEVSMQLLDTLYRNDMSNAGNLLKQFNLAELKVNLAISRTIVLMDATGSMGNLLYSVQNTVGIMFERAYEVLSVTRSNCSFEMQFACYRDYDSFISGLLEFSPWETNPNNLRRFMENVAPYMGGDLPEAIEIGLWHANKENSKKAINQVILIGDAPPKSVEQVLDYRKKHGGEKYWQKSKFGEATHYLKELQLLIARKVPVHAFYLSEVARDDFERIARLTNGRCEKLDIDSANGADVLTDLITEQILNSIGELQGNGKFLLEAYRNRHRRAHIN